MPHKADNSIIITLFKKVVNSFNEKKKAEKALYSLTFCLFIQSGKSLTIFDSFAFVQVHCPCNREEGSV